MKVEYLKGAGCPINIRFVNGGTAVTLEDAKQLRDELAKAIDEAEKEPELTEFEEDVRICVTENLTTRIKDGNGSEIISTVFIDDNTAKKLARELLELAKKELRKQGYIVEKHNALFDECVDQVPKETMKEVSDKVDELLQKDTVIFQKGVEEGRMTMTRITIEEAEQKMFDLLYVEDMGDRIYEFAQELFQRYINVIETGNTITNKDVLDRYEEWYDRVQEEFYQAVYNRVLKFLTKGE